MSIAWMAYAWKEGPTDPNDRYVFLALADNANDEGQAFPSLVTISEKTCFSESTVRRSIRNLEKGGWLTVIRGNGAGNRSKYTLKRVSDRKPSIGKVSHGKLSIGPEKGVSQQEKGVSLTEPPHPLKGVTVINHQEPSGEPRLTVAEQEEKIYEAYPRHTSRGAAITAIRKAVARMEKGDLRHPAMPPVEARRFLWRMASAYATSPVGQNPPAGTDDFRPHPATWFNQERYFDDQQEWARTNGNGSGAGRIQTPAQPVAKDAYQLKVEAIMAERRAGVRQ